ncbi:methyltransferase domain-containing protein [soil metagenome]
MVVSVGDDSSPPLNNVVPVSGYDAIAHDYAEAFADRSPLDRELLHDFGQLVGWSAAGPVLDVGCGPGDAAGELAATGLNVLGIDRSVPMVQIAAQRCRDVRFVVADMAALPLPDSSVGAVCSWYSIVHTPPGELKALFTEFRRVLSADGWILLAFQTNAPTLELTTAFGHDVDLRFVRHDVRHVLATLSLAGFTPYRHTVRPRADERAETADQAFVIARSARDHATGQVAAASRSTDADASSTANA